MTIDGSNDDLSAPSPVPEFGAQVAAAEENSALVDDTRPEPGSLHIAGRRSWKTWQLATAVVIAALVGMWFNGSTGTDSSSAAASGGAPSYKLPAAGPSGTSGASGASGSSSTGTGHSSTTTTTVASGSTTTTAPGDTTTTTAPVTVGPATVLVPATQMTGNWTSPTFNIAGGTWNIGWAYACSPVPAATPKFAVYVVTAGGSPGATPAVTSATPSGQSVTPQTTAGSQQLVVQSPTGCRWVVKVTGSSS